MEDKGAPPPAADWLQQMMNGDYDLLADLPLPELGQEAVDGSEALPAKRSRTESEKGDSYTDCSEPAPAAPASRSRRQAPPKSDKSKREKARRARESDCLAELSQLLDPNRATRTDKLSILADSAKEIKRLRTETGSLQRLNKILEERVTDLKASQEYTQRLSVQQPMLMPQQFMQHMAPQQPQQQVSMQPQMQPQQQQMQQPGMVAVPAAAFQQMMAVQQARYDALKQGSDAAAISSGELLSPAACLYMSSADLDVTSDSAKRPVAA